MWTSGALADPARTTARALVADWKNGDREMAAVAEVIASAFASGMSWSGAIGGKPVYCPPPATALTGKQVMSILESFVVGLAATTVVARAKRLALPRPMSKETVGSPAVGRALPSWAGGDAGEYPLDVPGHGDDDQRGHRRTYEDGARPVDPIKGGRRPPMVIGVDDRPTNVP